MTLLRKTGIPSSLTIVYRGSLESNKAMYVKGKVTAEFVDLIQRQLLLT